MDNLFVSAFESPLGPLTIEASTEGVTSIRFVSPPQAASMANSHTELAMQELKEYFAGKRHTFTFSLAPQGTEFQQSVWQALTQIPYGQTASYSDIAHAINKPKAVRAVGAANGRNPLSIVVPCHRIIGKNGTLTGYAGGLDRKAALLELEQKGQ